MHETLWAALAAVQAELPDVRKDKTAKVPTKTGGQYSYTYADLADVSRAILPILGRHGLAFTAFPTLNTEGRFVLRYILAHESGQLIEASYPLVGTTAQEIGSSLTYARRYALCAVTGVAADEDDDGAAATQAVQRDQKETKTRQRRSQRAPGASEPAPPAEETPETPAFNGPETLATVWGDGTYDGIEDAAQAYNEAAKNHRLDIDIEHPDGWRGTIRDTWLTRIGVLAEGTPKEGQSMLLPIDQLRRLWQLAKGTATLTSIWSDRTIEDHIGTAMAIHKATEAQKKTRLAEFDPDPAITENTAIDTLRQAGLGPEKIAEAEPPF